VQVVNVNFVFHDVEAEIVAFPDRDRRLDPHAG
jgi:hypothetical protein